jgi:hypothetical protein
MLRFQRARRTSMDKLIPMPANGQSGKADAHTPDGVNSAGPGAGEGGAYPSSDADAAEAKTSSSDTDQLGQD